MAIRFGSSLVQAIDHSVLGIADWFNDLSLFTGDVGGVMFGGVDYGLLLSPACYSSVRKVAFWAVVRHEHTGTALSGVRFRLRVAPSSSSSSALQVFSAAIASQAQVEISGSADPIWPNNGPTAIGGCYGWSSSRANAPEILKFGTVDTPGSQLVYLEFDRFAASSAAFFDDWDTVAAGGDEDAHISYTLGIERDDGVDWTDSGTGANTKYPVILACGAAVIQAPSAENRTRLYVPCTSKDGVGAIVTGGMSTFGPMPFFYNAENWSGDFEIRHVTRQVRNASSNGSYTARVSSVTHGSSTRTTVFDEIYAGGSANIGRVARSRDFADLLADGMKLVMQMQSGSGSQRIPFGHWEITTRSFNRVTVFFDCGHCPVLATAIPAGEPPPDRFDVSAGLFDPLWFQDFPEARLLDSLLQGCILHNNAITNSRQFINLNADLGADVSVSDFNALMAPSVDATDATVGYKLYELPIETNNPINLAGKRKLTERYGGLDWTSGTDDNPGRMGLAYVLEVPNSDIPELGPLFDVGAFNPEGCAATSAGLGEPPVLVITNGSTIPQKFNPTAAGTDAEVENAGIQTPFEGEVPSTTTQDAAASPDGGLQLGTYRYRYTFRNCCTGKESDPNPDDIVVDTSGQSPAAQVTLSFAGVRIPSDPQICEICLYRTVEGGDFPIMAKVGCFNVDEATSFVDDKSDDALDFLNDSLSILNAPMPCVPIVVDFRNRLFGMGDIPNLAPAGTVSVVNGSDIVTGDGDVLWDRCLEGKFIKVAGDCRSYEILRVLPPEEGTSPAIARLKLVDAYEGEDDTGLSYEVCGRPNRLYFSEPLEPEYWPAANFLDIEPGDGDRLMGAVSNFDRLILCKRRKTYVLTFRENPGTEVYVPSRISSDIGCIGPRTFAQVESGSVWLADRGLALYDGRTVQHVPESEAMNDIFTSPDNPNYVRRDRNGRVIEAVGVFYPAREQYLLLLPTVQTNRGCNLMLVWDVKLRNITLLKFCQEFLSMVVGKDSAGNERVYLGDTNGFVWIFDVGDTDGVGVPNATGTVRGTVSFAGIDTATGASVLDDDSASFLTGGIPGLADLSGVAGLSGALGGGDVGLAGVCVYTRRQDAAYDDPWTQRVVYAATPTRLFVTPPWGPGETPYDSSGQIAFDYMIGPIELDLTFKPQNYGTDDMSKRDWRQIVVHEVESFASKLRIDLLPDFSNTDPEANTVVDPVTEETGEGRVFRMDYSKGRQIKPVGRWIHFFMAVRMRNFAPEEPIRIINHVLGVEPRTSK